jgi:hypothetical protein
MIVLNAVLIAFTFLETLNVILLYKMPGSKMGNAVGVFKAYEKTRQDPHIRDFTDYLTNWVAGTKLIFIVLIIGIVIIGSSEAKIYSIIAMIFSIATFYIRLYPGLKKMDREGQIDPAGYSRTLAIMIGSFIAVFAMALAVYFVFFN